VGGSHPRFVGPGTKRLQLTATAIEFIKSQRESHGRLNQYSRETEHIRVEFDRMCQENKALREESGVMWQQLRHLEPGKPHIYGPITSQIAQDQSAAPGMSRPLPPIQGHWGPQPQSQSPASSGVMQGVEYPSGFDRR
jgi:hypothetical protein